VASKKLSHADVQRHLAQWLRVPNSNARPPVVAEELAIEGSWGDHGRIDVLLFRALNGYKQIVLEAYEVKATRADFLSDIRSAKWRRYLPRLTRFNFAAPIGVVKESDLPPEAGLIEMGLRKDGRYYWHRVRRAPSLAKLDGEVNSAGYVFTHEPPTIDTLARILYKVNSQRREQGWADAIRSGTRSIYPQRG